MNPAFSVIFLTTLIGAGQGLFVALYVSELLAAADLGIEGIDSGYFAAGSAVSLAFLVAGLFASFFHLGRPERAWRAIAMWRTSWLSRECIALPAFMATVFGYGALHHFAGAGPLTLALGAVGVVLCGVLFLCTGMIYACIRFLQEWASPLTVVNFALLGLASGFTLAAAYAGIAAPALVTTFGTMALVLGIAGLAGRTMSLQRNARLKPKSTVQSATGLRHPKVVQKAQGATGGSYNTRQYFHGASAALLKSVKALFLLLAFALPLPLIAIALAFGLPMLLLLAFVLQFAGLLAERWFFFAQANHPQNLYYQYVS